MITRDVGTCVVAGVLTAVGAVLAVENIAFLALVVGAVWLLVPARVDSTPKWLTVLLLGIIFGSLLPNAVSLLVQAITLVAGYFLWLATPSESRRAVPTVLWATAVIVYWAILMLHANIPSLDIGLLGFRKTVFCLVGLIVGVAIAPRIIPAVEQTVIRILLVGVAASIALYLFFPGLEQSLVDRNADSYTALIGGVVRLQGIFAGPFHAAVAGLILLVWGIARFSTRRVLASIALLLGGIAVYLTLVRTAYVALAIAIAFMVLASPTAGKVIRRLVGIALVAVVGLTLASSVNRDAFSVLDSITEFSTDTRFLGRFPGYAEGVELLSRSPIFGWGAGSAGDTLGTAFNQGEHVTSHNVVLKIAVEGGIIGLALWAALIVSVLLHMRKGTPLTSAAVGMLGIMIGMGLTGSSIEALPPTFLIFMFVGLALGKAGDGRKFEPSHSLWPRVASSNRWQRERQ